MMNSAYLILVPVIKIFVDLRKSKVYKGAQFKFHVLSPNAKLTIRIFLNFFYL